jgi:hypothetical protein
MSDLRPVLDLRPLDLRLDFSLCLLLSAAADLNAQWLVSFIHSRRNFNQKYGVFLLFSHGRDHIHRRVKRRLPFPVLQTSPGEGVIR